MMLTAKTEDSHGAQKDQISSHWQKKSTSQLKRSRGLTAVLAATLALSACEREAKQEIAIPGGLRLDELPGDVQKHLRATIAISDGSLNETEVKLDPQVGKVSGEFSINNVGKGGERTLTLRVYGSLRGDVDGESREALLGTADTKFTVTPGEPTYLEFKSNQSFDVCGAGLDGRCSIRFDENRNGLNNIEDLHAAIDPAPQELAVSISPSTLQFPSGIRLGQFARQVVVLENLSDNPLQVKSVDVVDAPGVAVSLVSSSGEVRGAPQRSLVAEDLGTIAAHSEVLVAVSFAPVNAFLAIGAVQAVLEDTVTHVQQGVRAKIIANSDGDLRGVDPNYLEPTAIVLNSTNGQVNAQPFPSDALYSGLSVTETQSDLEVGGLLRGSDAVLLTGAGDNARALFVDAAYLVDIAAGDRFSTALAGLNTDVDLAVALVTDAGLTDLACDSCLSQNAGTSDEAIEFENLTGSVLHAAVVLSRADIDRVPNAIAGALVASTDVAAFDLVARTNNGPQFLDEDPIDPRRGPLEGGNTVVLRGRGFQDGASVTFAGFSALDVQHGVDEDGNTILTVRAPPGSLEVGKNPATIVVENPPVESGGDGQAATLPELYVYDPPAPRLDSITPAFAPSSGGGQPITVRGAFFTSRFGPPVVTIGTSEVDGIYDSAQPDILLVTPPASLTPEAASTVTVRVRNRVQLDDGGAAVLGLASNGLVLNYVVPEGDPPELTSVSPSTGSVDGDSVVVVNGSGFLSGAVVAFGGVGVAQPLSFTPTQITLTAPAHLEGPVDVTITNPDGLGATLLQAFTYETPPPHIEQINPASFSSVGGTVLVVLGGGFRSGLQASFRRDDEVIAVENVAVTSSQSLLLVAPALSAGTWQLEVVNSNGVSATGEVNVFTPAGPAPEIESLLPSASGDIGGGNTVQILGSNFAPTSTVTIGGAAVEATYLAASDAANTLGFDVLTLTAPPSSVGAGPTFVQVVNPDGQSASAPYTYNAPATPEPRILVVSPSQIVEGSAAVVSLSGINFASDARVVVGTQQASVIERSASFVRFTTPSSLPVGSTVIAVENPDGQRATASLTVLPRSIRITSTSPSPLQRTNSVVVLTVNGDGFVATSPGKTAVFLDGLAQSSAAVNVQSANALTVTLASTALSTGAKILRVESQNGTFAETTIFVTDPPPVAPFDATFLEPPFVDAVTSPVTMRVHGTGFSAANTILIKGTSTQQSFTPVLDGDALRFTITPSTFGAGTFTVEVANGATIDSLPLRIFAQSTLPGADVDTIAPSAIQASSGLQELVVTGSFPGTLGITSDVGGAMTVLESSSSRIKVRIDTNQVSPGEHSINVTGNNIVDSAIFFVTPAPTLPGPDVESIAPNLADVDTSATFVLHGNFSAAATVSFSPAIGLAAGSPLITPNEIRFSLGSRNVVGNYVATVNENGQQDSISFALVPPQIETPVTSIDLIAPTTLEEGQGLQTVVLLGTFDPSTVALAGAPAGLALVSQTATELRVTVDTSVVFGEVRIGVVDAFGVDEAVVFVVPSLRTPAIGSVIHNLRPNVGTQPVLVNGEFTPPVTVMFDGVINPTADVQPDEIRFNVDTAAMATGEHIITLLEGGRSDFVRIVVQPNVVTVDLQAVLPSTLKANSGVQTVTLRGLFSAAATLSSVSLPILPFVMQAGVTTIDVDTNIASVGDHVIRLQEGTAFSEAVVHVAPPDAVVVDVDSVTPNALTTGQGLVSVVLRGSFPASASVTLIGGSPSSLVNPQVFANEVRAQIDTNTIGQGERRLRVTEGSAVDEAVFFVSPPAVANAVDVESATPSVLSQNSGAQTVVVRGTFTAAATLQVVGPAVPFSGINVQPGDARVTLDTTNAPAGEYRLRISDGTTLDEAVLLIVAAPPVIDAVVGNIVADRTTQSITLIGRFAPPVTVLLDGSVLTSAASSTAVVADINTILFGAGDHQLSVVQNGQTTVRTLRIEPARATIASVTSVLHDALTNEEVRIVGQHLDEAVPLVFVDGIPLSISVVSPSEVLCFEPGISLALGPHVLTVQYPGQPSQDFDIENVTFFDMVNGSSKRDASTGTFTFNIFGDGFAPDVIDVANVRIERSVPFFIEPLAVVQASEGALKLRTPTSSALRVGDAYEIVIPYFGLLQPIRIPVQIEPMRITQLAAGGFGVNLPLAAEIDLNLQGADFRRITATLSESVIPASCFDTQLQLSGSDGSITTLPCEAINLSAITFAASSTTVLPSGGLSARVIDAASTTNPVLVAESDHTFHAQTPQLFNSGITREWSRNPVGIVSPTISGIPVLAHYAVERPNDPSARRLLLNIDGDTFIRNTPPGDWSLCAASARTGASYSCSGVLRITQAGNELEFNNDISSPTGIGISQGVGSGAPGTARAFVTGTVDGPDVDRFFFHAPQDGKVAIYTTGRIEAAPDPADCVSPAGTTLRLSRIGGGFAPISRTVGASTQVLCAAIGIDEDIVVPAGDYIVEVNNRQQPMDYFVSVAVAEPAPIGLCGDGFIQPGEQSLCDQDGGVDCGAVFGSTFQGFASCDDNCHIRAEECVPSTFTSNCGNGFIDSGEQCDGANLGSVSAQQKCAEAFGGDPAVGGVMRCNANCTMDVSDCTSGTICGDGITAGQEECDTGTTIDGEGCDTNCTLTRCGNGIRTSGEGCDDGNNDGGDGCDAFCQPEAGFDCADDTCEQLACVNIQLRSPGLGTEFEQSGAPGTFSTGGYSSNRGPIRTTLSNLVFPVVVEVTASWNAPGIAFVGTRSTGLPVAAAFDEPLDSNLARVHNQFSGNNTVGLSAGGATYSPSATNASPQFGVPYRITLVDNGSFTKVTWRDLSTGLVVAVDQGSTSFASGAGHAVISGDSSVSFTDLTVCSSSYEPPGG